jgi:hypothetical protein
MGVGDGVGMTGVAFGVACGVADGVGIGDGVGVVSGVAPGVGVIGRVAVAVGSTEAVGVDGAAVGVSAAVGLTVGSGVGTAIGEEAMLCGSGAVRSKKSALFSFVSWPEPPLPPGSRSIAWPDAGAAAAAPSIHELAALPQPTASMAALAPRIRTATLPPGAARPLV